MNVPTRVSSDTPTQPQKALLPFIIYLCLFFVVWTSWALWIYPHMGALGETTLTYALVNIFLRLLVWVLPVFLYLRYIDHARPLEYLRLLRYWKRGILVGLVLSLINFGGMWLRFGAPNFGMQYLTWNSVLSTSLLIGVIEEVPFRGFILQKLQERWSFWPASLVSALLFVGIHLPGWLSLHLLSLAGAISIFILGLIFGAALYYTKSLWAPVITHSLNDFLSAVLFHAS